MDSEEIFLSDGVKGAFPLECVDAMLIISVDLALARFKDALTCKELWLYVLRKRGLSSFVDGGSVTEILRRGTENVVEEDEEWSDEFEGCFESGLLRADEIFLVQALSSWLLVFPKPLSDGFSLWPLESTRQRKWIKSMLQSYLLRS